MLEEYSEVNKIDIIKNKTLLSVRRNPDFYERKSNWFCFREVWTIEKEWFSCKMEGMYKRISQQKSNKKFLIRCRYLILRIEIIGSKGHLSPFVRQHLTVSRYTSNRLNT